MLTLLLILTVGEPDVFALPIWNVPPEMLFAPEPLAMNRSPAVPAFALSNVTVPPDMVNTPSVAMLNVAKVMLL